MIDKRSIQIAQRIHELGMVLAKSVQKPPGHNERMASSRERLVVDRATRTDAGIRAGRIR
jgi:hypothetical protein